MHEIALQGARLSRAQISKRMIEKMGREDESEDKKMVIPPAKQALQPPVDHVELQFDASQLALRKPPPKPRFYKRLRALREQRISGILGPLSSFEAWRWPS
jgi:hypothetical protein